MKTLKDRLGQNLKILRTVANLSQAELAEKAHVSIQVVRRIEQAAAWPDYASLNAIATALKINEIDLVAKDFGSAAIQVFTAGSNFTENVKVSGKRQRLVDLITSLEEDDLIDGLISAIERGTSPVHRKAKPRKIRD